MKKLIKLGVSVLMAGAILLSLSGCGTDNLADDNAAEEITVEELMTNVLESMTTVDTYHQESEMVMNMSGISDGEEMEVGVSMNMTGDIDQKNGNMMADVVMTMDMGEELGQLQALMEDIQMIMYVVDNEAYIGYAGMFGLGDSDEVMWMSMEFPETVWEQQDTIAQQQSLLESSEFTTIHAKTETVNGVECYLVDLDPDLTKLWNTTGQMTDQLDMDIDMQESLDALKESFKTVNVKYWIAKDTWAIQKLYEYMEIELSAEQFGGPEGENMNITMELTTTMSGYNKPVTIVLPEMENVMEMP